jgi:hypothetical protein
MRDHSENCSTQRPILRQRGFIDVALYGWVSSVPHVPQRRPPTSIPPYVRALESGPIPTHKPMVGLHCAMTKVARHPGKSLRGLCGYKSF